MNRSGFTVRFQTWSAIANIECDYGAITIMDDIIKQILAHGRIAIPPVRVFAAVV